MVQYLPESTLFTKWFKRHVLPDVLFFEILCISYKTNWRVEIFRRGERKEVTSKAAGDEFRECVQQSYCY